MSETDPQKIAIVGGGPAGLFAAEYLTQKQGFEVHLFDQKPSVGRKFLIAGRGGLNLTHSEPLPDFLERYGQAAEFLKPHIEAFPPQALRSWAEGLGSETFVGSSGRVFPVEMKASKLMRAWSRRLLENGLQVHLGQSLTAFPENQNLHFKDRDGHRQNFTADAILFAMGGASYPHLGASGSWLSLFQDAGLKTTDFSPLNCGFDCNWSPFLIEKFEGQPLKNIAMSHKENRIRGDLIVTKYGLEGGAIYALSRELVQSCKSDGSAQALLDLLPDMPEEKILRRLQEPRKKLSFSNYLRKKLKLSSLTIALLHEAGGSAAMPDTQLAALIKKLPVAIHRPRPLQRAISSSGGLKCEELDQNLMIKSRSGLFAAGEMIDWDAPTGGYLLQACFATGIAAAKGIEKWLNR
ncbi:TIGR03862 family flavoprotein [Sneathiella glossodoripedis]|uniref:TIGR03862 family flavoprotein n=1 Tax=Sneathiella glossodoripedis TaxID=418853 RepID=UPI000472AF4B|nr:TIGR03862 family flavoprotein [Sneathiella glossodoripedis]